MSIEEYNQRLERQGGVCAICKKPETFCHRISGRLTALSIDHSHVTGKNRDLCCRYCNSVLLPIVENQPELVAAAIAYLKEHNDRA
jgi:recombination endonuclease VII